MPKQPGDDSRLVRFTRICLGLPETTCERSGKHATYRVRDRTFAYFLDDHHGDGIVALNVRTARGENEEWIASDRERFYMPAYIGHRGWVGLRLDAGRVDWREVERFVRDSYRMAAPRKLAAMVAADAE